MKLYDASRVNSTAPSAMYLFNSEWRRRIELSTNSSDIFTESRIPNLRNFLTNICLWFLLNTSQTENYVFVGQLS